MISIFKDSVIELFVITYDCNPDLTYSFVDYDKAIASIEGSVRGYIGEDCEQTDLMAETLVRIVRGQRKAPVVPIRINDLTIIMHTVQLDDTNRIHQMLEKVHAQVNENTQAEIELLFKAVV